MNCRTEQHLQFHVIQTSFYLSWHKCQTLVCPWTGCWQETVAEWVMPVILKSVSQHGLPGKEQVMLGQERKSDVGIYFLSWRGNGWYSCLSPGQFSLKIQGFNNKPWNKLQNLLFHKALLWLIHLFSTSSEMIYICFWYKFFHSENFPFRCVLLAFVTCILLAENSSF